MTTCKNCGAALEEGVEVCPSCGADLTETVETVDAVETPVEAPKKKSPAAAIIAIVAVILALGVGLFFLLKPKGEPVEVPEEVPGQEESAETPEEPEAPAELDLSKAHHVNAYGLPSWSVHFEKDEEGSFTYTYLDENGETRTVTQEELDEAMDRVVATVGDMALTNRALTYYYDQQYYGFYSQYQSYLAYFMDQTKGLDEQLSMGGETTWQQYFLDAAAQGFHQTAAIYQAALEAGFQLDEEAEAVLASLEDDMTAFAAQYGFASAREYLQDYYGPAASFEDYADFARMTQVAAGYVNQLGEAIEVTDEDLSTYFDEHAEEILQNYHVEKIDKNVIDVRHILITPEDAESEDSWTEAEAKANELLEAWKSGDATEDSFAALAAENTQDPGSAQTGGLYEDVYPGQMVPEFNDWCFADGRQVGDTAVVKTSYGYHIMFFSGEGDYVYWKQLADQLYRDEVLGQQLQAMVEAAERTYDLSQVVYLDRTAPTVPVVEEEVPAEEVPAEEATE